MDTAQRIDRLRGMLVHRRALIVAGHTDKRLAAAVARGELLRLRRGWYVTEKDWLGLSHTERHLVRMIAAQASAQSDPVFSHPSAALLHGLPLLRAQLERVHTTRAGRGRTGSTAGMVRHVVARRPEVECIAGMRCTSLLRTAVDIACSASFEAGVICGDSALRALCRGRFEEAERWRGELLSVLAELPRGAGHGRARRVLGFLSPLAESPLESLSRLQLTRLGYEVREQVRVPGPDGIEYRMDFEFVGLGAFGEADGREKYVSGSMRGGKTLDEVLLREKAKQDWVQGVTMHRTVRWGWSEAWSLARFAGTLRAFGLEPPNRLPRADLF